jgi:TetR/AcrR family transcriptional regulator
MTKSAVKKARRRPAMPIWANKNQTDARRTTILREAAGCFNQKGYHGTTIDDIAERLNVTKGALYHYVRNKEELLFECHQIALDIGMEGLRLAHEAGGSPDVWLKTALKHYIEGVNDKLQGSVVLLEEGMLTPKHYQQVVRRRDEFERRIRGLVEAGMQEKIFPRRDIKIVVFAMLGAANWMSKWYTPEGERTAEQIAQIFVDYLVDGLRAPVTMRAPAPEQAAAPLRRKRVVAR